MVTVKSTVPVFEAEAIIGSADQNPSTNTGRMLSQFDATVPLGLDIFSSNASSSDLVPKILGKRFLETLLTSNKLVSHLKGNPDCGDKAPTLKSITGILVFLKIYDFKDPNEAQKKASLVDCLKNMISIRNYKFEKVKTDAFVVNVRDRDSSMAREITNQIIDQYFVQEMELKKRNYEKTISYFSEKLAKTKIQFEDEKKKLDQFLLANSKFVSVTMNKDVLKADNFYDQLGLLSGELVIEISQLEKELSMLSDALEVLVEALEKSSKPSVLLGTMERKKVTINISMSTSALIERLANEISPNEKKLQELEQKIREEVERLTGLSTGVKNLLNEKNTQLEKVVADSKTLDEIRVNYLRKFTYYEQLKTSMERKNLEAGILEVTEPTIYSRATQPLVPVEPNIKNIFAANALIAMIIGFLSVFIKQLFTQKIYHIRQLDFLHKNTDLIMLSKKDLSLSNLLSEKTRFKSLNANFFKNIKDSGTTLCVIDIQENSGASTYITDNLSIYFAKLLKQSNKNVLCCMNHDGLARIDFSKKSGSVYSLPNTGNYTVQKDKIALTSFEKQFDFIEQKNLKDLVENKFDKTFISLGDTDTNAFKFERIDNCDFFILVGFLGSFTLEQFKSFMIDSKIISKKYLGCVLVAK